MLEPESQGVSWIPIVAERKIAQAMEEGVFDNLPGHGKPLILDDDPLTPPHLRAVHRILKNSKVVPTWMSLEQEIDAAKAEAELFRTCWFDLATLAMADEQAAARDEYQKLMRRANDLILKFNIMTPFVYRAPIPFRIKARLAQWDADIVALIGDDAPDIAP